MSHIIPIRRKIAVASSLIAVAAAIVVWKNLPQAPVPVSAPAPSAANLDPIKVGAPGLNDDLLMRPDLRQALGKVAGITPQQRLDLLAAIRGTLTSVECDALLHELLLPRPPAISEGWYSVYIQNIGLILREQAPVRERYARALAELVRDPSRDAVIRDYAVQHLRQVWDRAAELPAVRQGIEATFRDLVKGGEPAMAATGLLSLHLLGTLDGGGAVPARDGSLPIGLNVKGVLEKPSYYLSNESLQPLVDQILEAPPSAGSIALRMTALRIISDRKLDRSHDSVRSLVVNYTEHTLVRMAAIGTLGILKNPDDRQLLESLDRSDLRIAGAVKTALASLK